MKFKFTDLAIIAMGLGLILVAFGVKRAKGKANWMPFLIGGVTVLLIEVVALVFGLTL